jgi:hypothetical protein
MMRRRQGPWVTSSFPLSVVGMAVVEDSQVKTSGMDLAKGSTAAASIGSPLAVGDRCLPSCQI